MSMLKTVSAAAVVLAVAPAAGAQPPVRPGETPRTEPSRSVTLSLTEYNRLMDLASRPPQQPPAAPVPAVLASADLRVRVDRDAAHGVFALAGDVLRDGINRVALISGATLIEAHADGRPLPLVADGTAHAALLSGPGPFAVTLEWGTALTFTPGRASFVLPVPPAGSTRATIDVPGEQADVHVSAGLVTRRSAAGGRTVVDVTLRPGTATEVWWSMRDSASVAAARDVRMLADVLTLVTIGDSEIRMAALVDLTVTQGEPRTIDVRIPGGYELTGISGSMIESSEPRAGGVLLTVADPAVRRHQFLVSLERPHAGGSFRTDTDLISLPGVQRERGEIAVEGVGTLELNAAERTGMHRIDVRELNSALQSLARLPVLTAFRYQRSAGADVALALDVRRFGDASVLAAVADRAVALVTAEGRALTEVVLQVRNRAQPFLKVTLPQGATIVSVEVAGEGAKPVVGADGTRVPLLRPGFRPTGVYSVSYVYLHAGAPFTRKGDLRMALPKMDLPVGLVDWEVFVPDRYRVVAVDGNVIARTIADLGHDKKDVEGVGSTLAGVGGGVVAGIDGGAGGVHVSLAAGALPGQVRGRVTDGFGAPLPGATILLDAGSSHLAAVSAGDGTFSLTGVPTGSVTASARLNGFVTQSRSFAFDQQPREIEFALPVAAVSETVSVQAAREKGVSADGTKAAPSQNVLNLQRRAAGVLPIRVDVPRAGTSHRFVKPLVVDQEATVGLRYRRR